MVLCASRKQRNTHPKLAIVELWANKIGNKGACALAEVVATSKTLKQINLNNNCILEEGALALANAFLKPIHP